MKMSYVAEVIRGWPNEGALDRAEVIKASTTLVNGDWVAKQSDGTVAKSGASAAGNVGLVMQGNGDAASAANSNKAVVLWSGFVANISNYDTNASYVPGSALTAKNGILTLASAGNPSATPPVYADPIVGYVLDVVVVGANDTAHLTVKVA